LKPASKVVLNTGILYAQLLVAMVIGLFTTRIVLNALGETNYGIYMLVAGVVGMLGILNSNMTNTSMRYMAHSLGTGDRTTTLKTFNTTLFLHFAIGSVVVVIMLAGGWLMFEYLLNIPPEKVFDAKVVFSFMVITTFITVISVPYDAVMNSHENILALALVDILGYILKLGVAIYLTLSNANLLILYGFLMLLVHLILRIIKQWYSKMKYEECKIRFREYTDRKLMKSILSFTGWNLFGSIASMASTQVRGILINMFFGVKLNAAEGISKTASSSVNMVSSSMNRAINPQLMKSEGGGDRTRMLRITFISTKFSAFLFALFAIPVLLEAPYLLKLWLNNVPEFAVIFCQITLITMLLEKFSFQITAAIRAVGDIRLFQITETIIIIMIVPIAYIVFKMGYPPVSIYIIGLLITSTIFFVRLYFGRRIAGIDIPKFFKEAIFPALVPIMISFVPAIILMKFMDEGIARLLVVVLIYCAILAVTFWTMGLKASEKTKLAGIARTAIIKRKKFNFK